MLVFTFCFFFKIKCILGGMFLFLLQEAAREHSSALEVEVELGGVLGQLQEIARRRTEIDEKAATSSPRWTP